MSPTGLAGTVLDLEPTIEPPEPWVTGGLGMGLILWLAFQDPRLGPLTAYGLLMELAILGIFGAGWWISKKTGRSWRFVTLFWLYLFGLFFEVVTEDFWDYLNVIFLIRKDISLTFPLAWTGLCIGATSLSEDLYRKARGAGLPDLKDHLLPRLDAVVWMLMGGVTETLFHWLDVIHAYVHVFPMGLSPTGVPWAVYLGYAVCPGFLVNMLIRNLETPSRD